MALCPAATAKGIMKNTDFYSEAHLVVAAIRILENRNAAPPSIEDVCKILSFSLEQGNLICKKLNEIGIINLVEGGYGTRLFIKDHLKIEEIPQVEKGSTLEEELKRFQNAQKDFTRKIESLQAKQAKEQKNLFAELENKLKEGLAKK
ncbi:MAG: hypothetical protein AUJ48_01360 [Deltaproteobacteria bacterium CG1_02_45_11]|nr:MAG: hypothetical protein AUJ48_01360 [Deltaproteobacteria bacterium CG1_02_45_11]